MGVNSLHPQVICETSSQSFLQTIDQQSVIHSKYTAPNYSTSFQLLKVKKVINPLYLTQASSLLSQKYAANRVVVDFKEGPDIIDLQPSSSYAWFLPSKTTAQAVRQNTLHPGMKLNLHPKYVEHSITFVKLEQAKRREQGKPIKKFPMPKKKMTAPSKKSKFDFLTAQVNVQSMGYMMLLTAVLKYFCNYSLLFHPTDVFRNIETKTYINSAVLIYFVSID